jgi:hypothetical protein
MSFSHILVPDRKPTAKTILLLVTWSELVVVFTHRFVENQSVGEALHQSLVWLAGIVAVAAILWVRRDPLLH